MKITIHEKSNDKINFTLSGVSVAYANTLRRLMIGEVPTMAIEDVTISKNDSILYDEIIAHRLGLVVFKTDLKSYNMQSVCKCKGVGCAQCQLKITLSEEGPKTVYAEDLKSEDPKVIPVHKKTVLVKLLEGQRLEVEAIAILGIGKEHSKWNPGLVWYYNEPVFKINNKHKDFDKFKDQYPSQVFNAKGQIDAKLINSPQLVDACTGINEEIVKITRNKDSFVFTVESFGSLSAKEIVEKSMEVYNGQIKGFEKLVKEL